MGDSASSEKGCNTSNKIAFISIEIVGKHELRMATKFEPLVTFELQFNQLVARRRTIVREKLLSKVIAIN